MRSDWIETLRLSARAGSATRSRTHGLSVRIVYAMPEIGTETSNLGVVVGQNANINFATGRWKMQWRTVKDSGGIRRRGCVRGGRNWLAAEGGGGRTVQLRHRHKRFKQVRPHIAFVPLGAGYIVTLHTASVRGHCSTPMKRRLTYLPARRRFRTEQCKIAN